MSVHLQLSEIKKCYRSVKALNSVSLEMEGGKIIVLLGVNGAGKSTLMRILSGLENADSEPSSLTAKTEQTPKRCGISTLVFQKTAMFTMNVYDNLAYGLKIRKVPQEEIAKRVPSVGGC